MATTMPTNPASSEKLAKRNARIKKAVAKAIAQGKPQYEVAQRFALTGGAISQIVRNDLSDCVLVRIEV